MTKSGCVFEESQVFRIDHYLGKETVQNLAALRFANSLFEPLWRHAAVDHVQITVAEDLGIGDRAEFYDRTGALRDMVQNHMLQLLCLVAMEPPISLSHEELRAEKIKVLKALRPITPENVKQVTVRGQYSSGAVAGELVEGYQDELGQQQAERHGDFCGHQGRNRQLALGRNAVLPAHRQAAGEQVLGDRAAIPAGRVLDLSAGFGRARA